MKPEKKEHVLSKDEDRVLEKTAELTRLLCKTDAYKNYEADLAFLKGQQAQYDKLNAFRKKHLELEFLEKDESYYDKTEALYEEYKDILMESAVRDFLASEQRVCRMMKKVYDAIALEMNLDISYMD